MRGTVVAYMITVVSLLKGLLGHYIQLWTTLSMSVAPLVRPTGGQEDSGDVPSKRAKLELLA